jgi:hypothetical protein
VGLLERPLGTRATAAVIFVLGFVVALAGDACHVTSGTTEYEWDALPDIWQSRAWFPFLVAGSVTAGAWVAYQLGLPAGRVRPRTDVVLGAAVVLALYALTAALREDPTTVAVVLTGSVALAVWAWWDPSPGALVVALTAAILGPFAEIALVELDAAHYASDADELAGVALWLPCLYFGVGAVVSGLWAAVAQSHAHAGEGVIAYEGEPDR